MAHHALTMKRVASQFCSMLCAASIALADGDVIFDVGSATDAAGGLDIGTDGRFFITAAVSFEPTAAASLLAFEANGLPVANFGTNGRTDLQFGKGPLAVRPNGTIILGANHIETYSATGLRLSAVSGCGVGCLDGQPVVWSWLPLADGRAYGGGGFQRITNTYESWTLTRVTSDGQLDPAFANGAGWARKDGGTSAFVRTLRELADGKMMALGDKSNSGNASLGRLNADGSTDFSFGTNGIIPLDTLPRSFALEIDQAQRVLMAYGNDLIQRRNPDGSVDGSYTGVPRTDPVLGDFRIDSSDRVIVFGASAGQVHLTRLLANGGVDTTFGTGGTSALTPPGANGAPVLLIADSAVDASNRLVLLLEIRVNSDVREVGLLRVTADGNLDTTFGAGWVDADAYPDAFAIAANTAPFGTAFVISEPVTPTGFNVPTLIRLSDTSQNRGYSIGCTGNYLSGSTMLQPGQSICLRHSAPPAAGETLSTTVHIGGRTGTYTTTAANVAADTTPDAFSFTDQAGTARSTPIVSNAVTINGITGLTPIAVDLGQYSINCDPNGFRSSGSTITNGQSVCVRVTSSANFATSVNATLAVGGVTDAFTVITAAADTTPAAFSFQSVPNVATSSIVGSGPTTITGINAPADISVTNGEYSVGCSGTFTTQAGTINPEQTVCLRHTSAAAANTTQTTTLNIGGVPGTFSSTTAAASPSGNGGGGGAISPRDLLWLGWLLLIVRSLRLGNRAHCTRWNAFANT